MRAGLIALTGLLAALLAGSALGQGQTCTKGEFEGVVDEAAAALRTLNQQNVPQFQVKLRQLKDKRGWSNDQFMKEAEPFVRDEQIAAHDRKSEEFLARITSAGQVGASAAPDCALLAELRGAMKALVDTQTAKWAYMFDKLEKELRK